jgi:hypothetical protein
VFVSGLAVTRPQSTAKQNAERVWLSGNEVTRESPNQNEIRTLFIIGGRGKVIYGDVGFGPHPRIRPRVKDPPH